MQKFKKRYEVKTDTNHLFIYDYMDNTEIWWNLWTQKVELFGQHSIKGDILKRKKKLL